MTAPYPGIIQLIYSPSPESTVITFFNNVKRLSDKEPFSIKVFYC